jgi:bifunctional DNA-binding transcriptional regulator/antitoxin component of YhaV-PrlF toxin-antitoxin module
LTSEKGEESKSFVARVQKEFRIQIPEPLRVVLGIIEGDLVEVSLKKAKPPAPPEQKQPAV